MRLTLIFLIYLIFAVSGCAKVQHLDQLLTLKAMSEEGERQDKYIASQDKKFKQLLSDIQNNNLKKDLHKKAAVKKYGDPINETLATRQDQDTTMLLFRYAMKPFDSEKVYLYFDKDGRLIDWEYVEHVAQSKSNP